MYDARVIKVMIASPSDVQRERHEVRDILNEWNAVNSEAFGLVLVPVGWESHAAPELGTRPQAIINRSVLDGCDLLVAIFWTRLGTPTGEADSGTAEEIQRHLAAGKSAMLYFSDAPAAPSTIDPSQHAALLAFKKEMEKCGLVETFSTPGDFAGRFRHQLALAVLRSFRTAGGRDGGAMESRLASFGGDGKAEVRLSADAKTLLLEAAMDTHGNVLKVRTMSGTDIHTNGKVINAQGDCRSEAQWETALNELVALGALEPRGYKNEIFAMTHVGYTLADYYRAGGE